MAKSPLAGSMDKGFFRLSIVKLSIVQFAYNSHLSFLSHFSHIAVIYWSHLAIRLYLDVNLIIQSGIYDEKTNHPGVNADAFQSGIF